MIRIFIGYDSREKIAMNVLAHSIFKRSSKPVAISPIMLSQLQNIHTRERHPLQSTDFSFSRFLTPYLCNFEGWAIFMDCDMLVMDDISKLWEMRDNRFSIQVVKHKHIPKNDHKFLNQVQSKYEKKNWSSVILFNNAQCRKLTPDYVDTATGLELHQFKWLSSESEIGEIPARWNHLVDYNLDIEDPANLHFTNGGPYFEEYRDCSYSDLWRNEFSDMISFD